MESRRSRGIALRHQLQKINMAPSENFKPSPSTSTQLVTLVNQAREGNRSAFTQLADQFHGDIFRMVYYRIRSQVDAEDITQDVFLKAFQKVSSVKDAAKFRSWLFSIAMNRIRDFQRKKRFRSLFKKEDHNIDSEPEEVRPGDQPQALEQVMKKDFWRQIGLILERLPKMEREVFLLRFFDQLSIKEIAGTLKKNENTIKTHLYRALAKFKKEPAMRRLLTEVVQ